jgi:hypothetical protein
LCVEELNENHTILEKLKKIGNTFLNSTETSAQEACYDLLSMICFNLIDC